MTILLRNPTRIEVPWTKKQEGILIADQAAAIERFLDRHLNDEEDLAVPILLHHRLRG